MDKVEFTCISCPIGCNLEVYQDKETKELHVSGNSCKRGVDFANEEYYSPRRVVTTVVSIQDEDMELLPVISDGTVPRNKVFDCIEFLQKTIVKKPIHIGQVIVGNILDTDIDIVAAKTIEK